MRLPRCVGDCLRLLRQARRWSQHDLARAARVSRAAVSKIEDGTVRPAVATVRTLVGVMGFSLGDLRLAQAIIEKRFE
jgi:transcriptional regulator with XRE-family HTH domain